MRREDVVGTDDSPTDVLLGLGAPSYTAHQVDDLAGLDREFATRLWRAMGFAEPDPDAVVFSDADADVLRAVGRFMEEGFADEEVVLAMTRVISQSVARVADAEASAIKEWISEITEEADVIAAYQKAPEVFSVLELFLVHIWRRQMAVALERVDVFEREGSSQTLVVGFADIVGFTRMSRQLDEADLVRVVETMESLCQNIVSEHGGRVVKMIGDEVMFAIEDAPKAATIALELLDRVKAEDERLDLRVGLALGPVVSHRGDLFGPTVNLASRIAAAAHPDSVLVSDGFQNEVAQAEGFILKPIPARRLKGVPPTQLWVLRRDERTRS